MYGLEIKQVKSKFMYVKNKRDQLLWSYPMKQQWR